MSTYGTPTPNGFLPNIPSVDDMLARNNLLENGWKSFEQTAKNTSQHQTDQDELMGCYVQTFGTDAGRRVLEDMLNKTLRRSPRPPEGFKSIEQVALHTAMRDGQNSVVVDVLLMMTKGKEKSKPSKKSSK